jgi:hypothetical protein
VIRAMLFSEDLDVEQEKPAAARPGGLEVRSQVRRHQQRSTVSRTAAPAFWGRAGSSVARRDR